MQKNDDILNYFNFYLGYGFVVYWSDGTQTEDYLCNVLDGANGFYGVKTDVYPWTDDVKDFKLILKHTCDMSKTEKKEYRDLCKKILDSNGQTLHIADTPDSLFYGIKRGYDLFDLIENGLAIDEVEWEKKKVETITPQQKQLLIVK